MNWAWIYKNFDYKYKYIKTEYNDILESIKNLWYIYIIATYVDVVVNRNMIMIDIVKPENIKYIRFLRIPSQKLSMKRMNYAHVCAARHISNGLHCPNIEKSANPTKILLISLRMIIFIVLTLLYQEIRQPLFIAKI